MTSQTLGTYPYVGLSNPQVAPRRFRSRHTFRLPLERGYWMITESDLLRQQNDPNRTPYRRHAVSCHRYWDVACDLAKPIRSTLG